ncbi:MAG: glycosyltransferase family 2 protein [Phycisphaerales bacterium]
MTLLIIIVNFRTPDLTIGCLRSLAPEVAANPGTRVVLVENGSGDDSLSRLADAIDRSGWQNWVTLIPSPANFGFAGGNNLGLREGLARAPADLVLLLNSDTIVHPGCLAHSVSVLDDATIGAMSCKLLNADGTIQNVSRRFPTPARLICSALGLPWRLPRFFEWADTDDPNWDRDRTARDVDWIGGAFLLIRADLLSRLGGLDDAFFFYGEDIVLCHRVRRAGCRVRYDPGSSTTHLGGSSSDPSRMAAKLRNIHAWRARYLVLRRCHGPLAAWIVRATDILSFGLRTILWRLRGPDQPKYADSRDAFRLLTRPLEASK